EAMPEPATFRGLPIIDTMIGFPLYDKRAAYADLVQKTSDRSDADAGGFPVDYAFKAVPGEVPPGTDQVAYTLDAMDRHGIVLGLVMIDSDDYDGGAALDAYRRHPDRFVASIDVDPGEGPGALTRLERFHADAGIRAVGIFPAGCVPQIPINHRTLYPVYARCVELDLPVFVCAGIPGPRMPGLGQYVGLIDDVLCEFPDLVFVTRHGCEPWEELAVALMRKHPNLHYSTSAFAPRHYPRAIVDFANDGGADQVIYAGYFPMGLSLERIVRDFASVPFADDVWPKFLYGNAARVLRVAP
ncbi:MAG: amidohydrolase 2, partial [Actinomycetia bacterium]|nr:amidohydrolase 2 [Actinomycetes bacterium]